MRYIGENLTFIENYEQLWNEICDRFRQSNGLQIYQIKRELDNLRQENMSIMNYYGKMKTFWDELKNFCSLPSCTCGIMSKCNC